jgi:hypothetical protein
MAWAVLAAGLWCVGGTGAAQDGKATFKNFLPPEVYKELVTRTAKAIEADLAAGKELDRAQARALMIMGYARSAQEGVAGTLEIEGAASKLARIVTKKGKLAEAKKVAAELAQLHGEALSAEAVLGVYGDLAELMNLLKPKGKGGEGLAPALQSNARLKGALNGVEEKIRALAKKSLTSDRIGVESEELALLGYKLAVLGELTTVFTQDARKGKGTVADWNRLCLEMRDESLALAAAAARKDAQATFKAATRLNTTCSECHTMFR